MSDADAAVARVFLDGVRRGRRAGRVDELADLGLVTRPARAPGHCR